MKQQQQNNTKNDYVNTEARKGKNKKKAKRKAMAAAKKSEIRIKSKHTKHW